MKTILFFFAVMFTIGASADTTYTTHTSTGKVIATFTQITVPGNFGPAWKDQGGKIWRVKELKVGSDYSTLKYDTSDRVTSSPAIAGCAGVEGEVPSKVDYLEFASSFEFDQSGVLSDQGKRDLAALFPETSGTLQVYWTSSKINNFPGVFASNGTLFEGRDNLPSLVRCIQKSESAVPLCGLKGATNERLTDCSRLRDATIDSPHRRALWKLVSRNVDDIGKIEIWKDTTSGKIWSEELVNEYSFKDSLTVDFTQCTPDKNALNCKILEDRVCQSGEVKRMTNGINDLKFSVPNAEDLVEAMGHEWREVLPHFNGNQLTSTVMKVDYSPDYYVITNLWELQTQVQPMSQPMNVHCVGK